MFVQSDNHTILDKKNYLVIWQQWSRLHVRMEVRMTQLILTSIGRTIYHNGYIDLDKIRLEKVTMDTYDD